ncbi:MAG: TetR/AcrR family transcriptional regulator [Candidatus Marinimicrobia bacterium]|nr:TetR/AcrR family transcriptional regulator [Candidatus Neomarinimicrobiota bacterium]MCF7830069.1 TetR/AcrR family transcriptional regulator [Candidatus Neomarinimicrobiota bacterium]MCF7882116.1 TetR/AcrR family transcriptional regulator [Candidatus Neomarinimicrobiota bacterium]
MTPAENGNQANREKILEVAANLFANHGYNGVSVREIAEAADVTKPVIYYYFENKEDLHRTLIQTAFRHAAEIHEQVYQSNQPADKQLRDIMRSHFRYCLENPDVVKILYDTIGKNINEKGLTAGRPAMLDTGREFRKFSDFVRTGQERGQFNPDLNPMKVGMMFLGIMNIFIVTQLHSKRTLLSDEFADELMDILLYGIANNQKLDASSREEHN